MNSMELSDKLWQIDNLIVANQNILKDKTELSEEEIKELHENRAKINAIFKEIEDEESSSL